VTEFDFASAREMGILAYTDPWQVEATPFRLCGRPFRFESAYSTYDEARELVFALQLTKTCTIAP